MQLSGEGLQLADGLVQTRWISRRSGRKTGRVGSPCDARARAAETAVNVRLRVLNLAFGLAKETKGYLPGDARTLETPPQVLQSRSDAARFWEAPRAGCALELATDLHQRTAFSVDHRRSARRGQARQGPTLEKMRPKHDGQAGADRQPSLSRNGDRRRIASGETLRMLERIGDLHTR